MCSSSTPSPREPSASPLLLLSSQAKAASPLSVEEVILSLSLRQPHSSPLSLYLSIFSAHLTLTSLSTTLYLFIPYSYLIFSSFDSLSLVKLSSFLTTPNLSLLPNVRTDSVAAVEKAGLADKMSHISTGKLSALLHFLSISFFYLSSPPLSLLFSFFYLLLYPLTFLFLPYFFPRTLYVSLLILHLLPFMSFSSLTLCLFHSLSLISPFSSFSNPIFPVFFYPLPTNPL